MEYECKIFPVTSLQTTFNKTISPLCSKCKNINCSNPIENKKISIFGKVHNTKLYSYGTSYYIVYECDGFLKDEEDNEFNDVSNGDE
jgi:hypothetical protein